MCIDLKIEMTWHFADRNFVFRKIRVDQWIFNNGSIVLAQSIEQPDGSRNQQEYRKQQDSFPELQFLSARYLWPFLEKTVFQSCSFYLDGACAAGSAATAVLSTLTSTLSAISSVTVRSFTSVILP